MPTSSRGEMQADDDADVPGRPRGKGERPGSETFETVYVRASANARAALRRAEAFRKSTRQKTLHMEHLLTGLFDTQESVAASRLRATGLDRQGLRDAMARTRKLKVPANRPYPQAPLDGLPPISEHVRQAFHAALRLAGPAGVVVSEFLLEGFLAIDACSVVEALPAEVRERLRARPSVVYEGLMPHRSTPGSTPPGDTPAGPPDRLRLEPTEFRPHVIAAAGWAASIAAGAPIDSATALLGVLAVSRHGSSSSSSDAFRRLSKLLPAVVVPSAPVDLPAIVEIELAPELKDSFALALHHVPERNGMWGREWIAIALLAGADPSLQFLARQAESSVAALQDAWFQFLAEDETEPSPEPWASWWRAAGVPLPSERSVRAGYHPESVKAEDRLGVDAEVTAFARLIADPATTPPLSIGLLGDWGSGKSFFMELLYDRVEELTAVVEDDPAAPRFVQIRFNAWHYSDANLWASLVGHIFDRIWRNVVPQTTPAESRRQLEREIHLAHGALFEAEAQADEARGVLLEAEAQIERELEELAIRRVVGDATRVRLHELAKKVEWGGPLDAVVEVEEALRQLSSSKRRLREVVDVALRHYPVRRTLGWIALSAVAATAVIIGASRLVLPGLLQDWAARAAAIGGAIASLVGAVAVPLSRASRLVGRFTDSLQQTVQEYTTELEAMRKDPETRNRAATIDRAREDLARAEVRAAAARERVADLETRHSSLDPGRRLATFLDGRVQSDDYRSRQGILSLVRRDFDRLSELMTEWRQAGTPPPPGVRPVARIVLYIDDLDRCPPAVVVQALEAIHLLLALRLFVVVVAVDSRWLLRSLEVHYKDLLKAREEPGDEYRLSTPHSYLEKIFQITFALAPMGRRGFADYVDFLAEPFLDSTRPGAGKVRRDASVEASPEPDEIRRRETGGTGSAAGGNAGSTGSGADGSDVASEGAGRGGAASSAPPRGSRSPSVEAARSLEIGPAERTFLKALHPLVPTPRLAKRLVNVFRLVKEGVPANAMPAFEDAETGRHRTVLLLLAILYGRSALALDLFRCLCDGEAAEWTRATPLFTALHDLGTRVPAAPATGNADSWSELATLVEAVAPDVTVGACTDEAPRVARYSLVTGQQAHTWIRRDEEPPP